MLGASHTYRHIKQARQLIHKLSTTKKQTQKNNLLYVTTALENTSNMHKSRPTTQNIRTKSGEGGTVRAYGVCFL